MKPGLHEEGRSGRIPQRAWQRVRRADGRHQALHRTPTNAGVDAIAAGAVGYVIKTSGPPHWTTLRAIGEGHSPLDPALIRAWLSRVRQMAEQQDAKLARLTGQESRILAGEVGLGSTRPAHRPKAPT